MSRFNRSNTTTGVGVAITLTVGLALGGVLFAVVPAGAGQGPSSVIVANTTSQPVPVAGTITATEGGAWNVALSGTAPVSVTNFPATQAVTGTVDIDPNSNTVTIGNSSVPVTGT